MRDRGKYYYICPDCDKQLIAFIELMTDRIEKAEIEFYCYYCQDFFVVRDQGGFLHHKEDTLRGLYPIRGEIPERETRI